MTTTATLYVSVNGGATTRGHVTAAVGDTLQFSRLQTDGARTVRYELYGFPPDFACPSGWSSAGGIYYYSGDTPPAVRITEWGKFLPLLRLNGASDTDATGLIDASTGIDVPSATGLHDCATGELAQCGGIDKTIQRDLRVLGTTATTSTAGLMSASQVANLTYVLQRRQINQYECYSRIADILGSGLVDVTFPADATLSGTNITAITATKSGYSLATTGTGNFTQAQYRGRMVIRNASNTGKRLSTSSGDTRTLIVAARCASTAQTCALIGGTAAGGTNSPYLYQQSGTVGAWYGVSNQGHNRCNGGPNINLYTTMEVYSRGTSFELATGFAVGGQSASSADFLGDIGVIVRASIIPNDEQYYEVARAIREYHGLPAQVPLVYFGNSLGGGYWFESMALPSRAVRKNNSIGAMGTLQIATDLPDRLPGEDHGEQTLVGLVWEGTNSLASGETAETVLNATWSICDQMRARGYKVIVGNVMPRADAIWDSTKETQRLLYNAGLASGWSSHADKFFDALSDARLLDPNNVTYFVDKLHLTATGYPILGGIVQAQAVSLLTELGVI